MVRKKNANLVGSPPPHVARDASIMSQTIDNASGDFALVFDKVTGANGHSSSDTINHSGSGRGCPLSISIAEQYIDRSIALVGSVTQDEYYILAVPIFVPAGTQSYVLEVENRTTVADEVLYCEVRNTSWTATTGPIPAEDVTLIRKRWYLTLGTGLQFLLVSRTLYPGIDFDQLFGWRLYVDAVAAGDGNGLNPVSSSASGSNFPALATMTPSTVETLHTNQTSTDSPLDSWVLTRLNRQINTMWEFLTGAKVPGNFAYQCSTVRLLNQATWTAEPAIDFPLACIALSCVAVSGPKPFVGTIGTAAPTTGPIDWVRYPQTQPLNTPRVISRVRVQAPSFSTSPSNLKAEALFYAYAGDALGNWQARIFGPSATAFATLTQIGTTSFWRASITGVPYTAGAMQNFQLEIQSTTLASPIANEVLVLGWTLYFDP